MIYKYLIIAIAALLAFAVFQTLSPSPVDSLKDGYINGKAVINCSGSQGMSFKNGETVVTCGHR